MRTQDDELFRLRFITEVRFGRGIRSKIVEYLKEIQAKRLVIIVDPNASENDPVRKMQLQINSNFDVLEVKKLDGEPEISEVEEIRKISSEFSPDTIVGIGGGSAIDTAKAIAAVLPNSKPAADYQGLDKLEMSALKSVMIPTLFGTGAEVTSSAVMINREKKIKGGINGRHVFPYMAIIDPELGPFAPNQIVVSSALDALVHAIEGYVARCATPMSRMFSKQASFLLLPALMEISRDKISVNAMEDIAFGSLLAVLGLMHSESGLCGAMSYPFGVHYGVPHGLAGGLMLEHAINFNARNGCDRYGELLPGNYGSKYAAEKIVDHIKHFIVLNKLRGLRDYGIDERYTRALSEEIFSFKSVLDMNPIKIDSAEIIEEMINWAL